MEKYENLSPQECENELNRLNLLYEKIKAKDLKLDISRGKPGFDQCDISDELFHQITDEAGYKSRTGIDCRNYGGLDGLDELKNIFGEILGVPAAQVIVSGNSSLNLMFDFITQCMVSGINGCAPWAKQGTVKFLCPVPGYDRHFSVTEYYGVEMINIECDENGPNMDEVEKLVAEDESIKGMWCVPKYSNPTGIVYGDETVRRIANMKTAAKDFVVMWDNAYAYHYIEEGIAPLLGIYDECVKAGNPDRALIFTSTSKITFPGAGVAVMAGGAELTLQIKKRMGNQTIGPDKLNQLRHARMFKTTEDIKVHMARHAAILKPKFEVVLNAFENELEGLGIAQWSKPAGGYFINLDLLDGCAARTAELCKNAGLVLTGAGATYPYGKDARDRNLRIAPSYPECAELEPAAALLCICVRIAALEKLKNN